MIRKRNFLHFHAWLNNNFSCFIQFRRHHVTNYLVRLERITLVFVTKRPFFTASVSSLVRVSPKNKQHDWLRYNKPHLSEKINANSVTSPFFVFFVCFNQFCFLFYLSPHLVWMSRKQNSINIFFAVSYVDVDRCRRMNDVNVNKDRT